MKNIITIFLALLAISCKSQTVSLETAAQCSEANPCPVFTYVKDINNTLNKYVGWKGVYNGRFYEMKFNKALYDDMGMKIDDIRGRIRITIPGNISLTIFDNFSEPDDKKTRFSGLGLTKDLQGYRMIFGGSSPQGCINHGTVSLRINPSTPNEMRVKYWFNNDIVVGECPSTFSQTFPEQQEILLTRQ
ncbi:hypothetical protein HIO71_06415 [Chryseobacterium aquaticum]|uniref:Lipoprotein n=1 Tax=Chryseobacterium aquaticum TaxID=452084 RepID=A0A848N4A9_9FLAO|nr:MULTISPECIES: hypothetical protein [Chryseobacterium]NMR33842.1 hypothetical protein [Chryseobacterium aquaticum]NRQ45918.1 hypothetical protein [Chryseobacterium sp. C-204]